MIKQNNSIGKLYPEVILFYYELAFRTFMDKSYLSIYFLTTNTIKEAFLFKARALLLVAPGNHVIANKYFCRFVGKNDNIFCNVSGPLFSE